MNNAGVTVLVDPWLVGQLTFGGLGWVYAGNKKGPALDPAAIAAGADFMLITQARPRPPFPNVDPNRHLEPDTNPLLADHPAACCTQVQSILPRSFK